MRKHILIFEAGSYGHQLEHIALLLKYYVDVRPPVDLTVVVRKDVLSQLGSLQWVTNANVNFDVLTLQQETQCQTENLGKRSVYLWKTARYFARKWSVNHVHFQYLDHLQLPLCITSLLDGVTVSGLLFRPSVHYDMARMRWFERVVNIRKHIAYRLMLRNNKLTKVLTLDPYFELYARESLPFGHKVVHQPDPAPDVHVETRSAPQPDWVKLIPEDRLVFGLFGALAERKGIFKVLDALTLLEREVLRSMAVMFVGRVQKKDRFLFEKIFRRIDEKLGGDLWIKHVNRFVPRPELAHFLLKTDVVLAPYQRFVGSSGVVLWAASAGKPIITQDYGLLGKIVSEHRLGITTDTGSPRKIAEAMRYFTLSQYREVFFSRDAAKEFAAKHDSSKYAEVFFAELVGDGTK